MTRTIAIALFIAFLVGSGTAGAGTKPLVQIAVESQNPPNEKPEDISLVDRVAMEQFKASGYPVLSVSGKPKVLKPDPSRSKPQVEIIYQVVRTLDEETNRSRFDIAVRAIYTGSRRVIATQAVSTNGFSPKTAAKTRKEDLRAGARKVTGQLLKDMALHEEQVVSLGRTYLLTLEVQSSQSLNKVLKQLRSVCDDIRVKRFSETKGGQIDLRCKLDLPDLQKSVRQALAEVAPGVQFVYVQGIPDSLKVMRR